jgi:glutamate-1-semialdehyde 2,1-aminomutase
VPVNDGLALSRGLLEESALHLASGVASTLRLAVQPTPLFIDRGSGARIVDVDGNQYIDYTMAYGPLILGHAHPAIVDAVSGAAVRGSTFGAQHVDEARVAQALCEHVPGAERVCFSGSGTEGVMLALRLARAFTGRERVIRFTGHYHGWSDAIFTAGADGDRATPGTNGQSGAALGDLIVLPWNDREAVEAIIASRGSEIAAVICEPVLCNSGCIEPSPGYLEALRAATADAGIILIFDEVITGFRLGLGGAQERYGVHADLAVFGKALGGGLPLSAVTGRREILDLVAAGTVSHLGTFNGNTVALAAARATLAELSSNGGAAFATMAEHGLCLAEGLAAGAEAANVALVVNCAGPVLQTIFTREPVVTDYATFASSDHATCAAFVELLLGEGVYVRPNGLWYVSTAHSKVDVDATLEAAQRAFDSMSRRATRVSAAVTAASAESSGR